MKTTLPRPAGRENHTGQPSMVWLGCSSGGSRTRTNSTGRSCSADVSWPLRFTTRTVVRESRSTTWKSMPSPSSGADGIDPDAVEQHPDRPAAQQPLPHGPQPGGVVGDPVRGEDQMIDAVERQGRGGQGPARTTGMNDDRPAAARSDLASSTTSSLAVRRPRQQPVRGAGGSFLVQVEGGGQFALAVEHAAQADALLPRRPHPLLAAARPVVEQQLEHPRVVALLAGAGPARSHDERVERAGTQTSRPYWVRSCGASGPPS